MKLTLADVNVVLPNNPNNAAIINNHRNAQVYDASGWAGIFDPLVAGNNNLCLMQLVNSYLHQDTIPHNGSCNQYVIQFQNVDNAPYVRGIDGDYQ